MFSRKEANIRTISVALSSFLQLQVKDLDPPNTSESFRRWHCEQIAADVKETLCRVSDTSFDAELNANIPTVDYEVCFLPANRYQQSPHIWQTCL